MEYWKNGIKVLHYVPVSLLLMVMLLFPSCKINKIDFHHLERNGEVILSMERTPCYGDCPVYSIKLYSNGLLLYNGEKFTDKTGCFYGKVSDREINQFNTYILEAGFFDLENKYPAKDRAPADLPNCILYFKSGNREKKIEDQHWETPQTLKTIEKKVDSLIASKKLHSCDK